ncbi:hypothetical protein V2H77_16870 [Photorhabdus sp. P32]
MSDASFELIAISGNYFSLLEDNKNKTVLIQVLNRVQAISLEREMA